MELLSGRPVHVLAVDDDSSSIAVLEAASAVAGFRFSSTLQPKECLDLVRDLEPDVVLLDAMMPEIDGFQLCRRIKEDEHLQLIPVVMVTALDSKSDKLKGLKAGCDDFMSKPVDRVELTARVHSLARVRRLTENLDDAEKVLESLARGVEAKDETTGDHCDRLTRAGHDFGTHLGLSSPEVKALGRAGVLHDIGKIGIPDSILLKPGKLTPQEWRVMETHTTIGADLLKPLRTMQRVVPIVRHHHERWDGKGYPERLSGEGIPYLARAFQLLDAFDALTSERPYKRAFSAEESCEILEKEALDGKWDPVMLEEFLVLRRGQREKNFLASREPQAEASGRDGP
jgi:putative two-component system response regulator